MAEQEAIGLLEQLARDFNVRDPRKLQQISAGVPGPAGPHRGEGPDGPAERRGQAGAGPQAQEPGEERRRGRTSGCRRTWWTSRRTQVRAGGDGRLHPGGGHEGAAQQAVGHGDAGGRGDPELVRRKGTTW